jgi:undecaprenyl-diphosphatase
MSNAFDTFLYHLINQRLTSGWMDFLMVNASDKLTWIPLYMVMIWMLIKKFGKKTLLILLFMIVAVFIADRFTSGVLKPGIGRVRPCHEAFLTPRLPEGVYCSDTGGMASSHAANHFAVALMMILLYGVGQKAHTAFWLFWAALISYSRVYCGVHYPTDVLVGALIGILVAYLCFWGYKKTIRKLKWE